MRVEGRQMVVSRGWRRGGLAMGLVAGLAVLGACGGSDDAAPTTTEATSAGDVVDDILGSLDDKQKEAIQSYMNSTQECVAEKGYDVDRVEQLAKAGQANATVPEDIDWDGYVEASTECVKEQPLSDLINDVLNG